MGVSQAVRIFQIRFSKFDVNKKITGIRSATLRSCILANFESILCVLRFYFVRYPKTNKKVFGQ